MSRRRCLPLGVVQLDLFAAAPVSETPPPFSDKKAPAPVEGKPSAGGESKAGAPSVPAADFGPSLNQIVAMLAEETGALTAADRRYLTGPVILHPVSECADWLRAVIPEARVRHILHPPESEKNLATLEDALAYLSSASLALPLAPDDAEQFFWLSQEVLPRYGLACDEPVWKSLGYQGPIQLSAYQQSQLRELRAKVRAAVVAHAAIARNRQHSTPARREEGEKRPSKHRARAPAAEATAWNMAETSCRR